MRLFHLPIEHYTVPKKTAVAAAVLISLTEMPSEQLGQCRYEFQTMWVKQ
jgi:hypothetical protein